MAGDPPQVMAAPFCFVPREFFSNAYDRPRDMPDLKTPVRRHVHLVGAVGAAASIRTADLCGVPHLVVPVVAMMGDSVVFAHGSDTPELVPTSELAYAPMGWNTKPVVGNHPDDGETHISAGTPEGLKRYAFGTVFNGRVEDNCLLVDAWLDPIKAAAVGRDASRVIERIRAGEMVEVSVGVYIISEPIDGEINGQEYHGRWSAIMPDHLALLPEGTIGACSNAAGCGAPRRATVHVVTPYGLVRAADDSIAITTTSSTGVTSTATYVMPPVTTATLTAPLIITTISDNTVLDNHAAPITTATAAGAPMKRKLAEILRGLWQSATGHQRDASVTDWQLRSDLERLLRATVPGYLGIDAVMVDDHAVIYAAAPNETLSLHSCGFALGEDGTVTLAGDPVEVEQVTSYEPVTASARAAEAHPCSCGGSPAPVSTDPPAASGDRAMKDSTKTLIAGSAGRFTEADAVWIDAVPEDRLAALAQSRTADDGDDDDEAADAEAAEKAAAEKAAADKAAADKAAADAAALANAAAKPKTEAEWMAEAPAPIKAIVARAAAAEAAQKADLLSKIKAAGITEYSDAELAAMPVAEVARVARLAKLDTPVADYSGHGVPRIDPAAARAAAEAIPPAPSLYDKVRASRSA